MRPSCKAGAKARNRHGEGEDCTSKGRRWHGSWDVPPAHQHIAARRPGCCPHAVVVCILLFLRGTHTREAVSAAAAAAAAWRTAAAARAAATAVQIGELQLSAVISALGGSKRTRASGDQGSCAGCAPASAIVAQRHDRPCKVSHLEQGQPHGCVPGGVGLGPPLREGGTAVSAAESIDRAEESRWRWF